MEYDYDLIVIGGGSGGLACAKESAKYGARVLLADYVEPSPHGTKWGLGGTCVNVGCIPKKLMHAAASSVESMETMSSYGFETKSRHSWPNLIENITNYIRSLNFKYRTDLRKNKVIYVNKYAKLVNEHTVSLTKFQDDLDLKTSKYIVICPGTRPTYPKIPGAELGITSDDIFWRTEAPGRVLVVGASYIALECAGFLQGLGFPTTVAVRSILLRGFDRESVEFVENYMKSKKFDFRYGCVPTLYKKKGDEIEVFCHDELVGVFDTVLFAIGRSGLASKLDLDRAGVLYDEAGKIICNEKDQTSIDNIYAIGDGVQGRPELTPVAIRAGHLLGRRLFNNSTELMDYEVIPTTVFTPLEYACCGISEEEGRKRGNCRFFSSYFTPLEWALTERSGIECFCKIITENEKVVGLHIVGPQAGEIMQGFACAMSKGITKKDIDDTCCIHPVMAETVCKVTFEKDTPDAKPPSDGGC